MIGIVALVIMLPVAITMIRYDPKPMNVNPIPGRDNGDFDDVEMQITKDYKIQEAAKTTQFYIIIVFFFAVALISGAYTHAPGMLKIKGLTAIETGYLYSFYQLGAAIAQFFIGVLITRYGLRRIMTFFATGISNHCA